MMGKLQDCLTLISGSPSYTTPPIVSVQFQFHASTSFTFLVQQISCRLDLIPLSWRRVCFLVLVKFFFFFFLYVWTRGCTNSEWLIHHQ